MLNNAGEYAAGGLDELSKRERTEYLGRVLSSDSGWRLEGCLKVLAQGQAEVR